MPITPALSAAKMRRNLGVTTVKFANISVTTDNIQLNNNWNLNVATNPNFNKN